MIDNPTDTAARRVALIVTLIAMAIAAPACTSYHPEYRKLAATSDSDPPPDALVGAWFHAEGLAVMMFPSVMEELSEAARRGEKAQIDRPAGVHKRVTRLYFEADGSGNEKISVWPPLGEEIMPFAWNYSGAGVWRSTGSVFGKHKQSEWRMTGDRLLRRYRDGGKVYYWVYRPLRE